MSEFKFTEDDLAQEIRRIDGNHNLGAGLLAEKMFEFIEGKHPAPAESDKEAVRNAALEEAAKVCDYHFKLPECPQRAQLCAEDIRALKSQPEPKPDVEPDFYLWGDEVIWKLSPEMNECIRQQGTPLFEHPPLKSQPSQPSDSQAEVSDTEFSDEAIQMAINAWFGWTEPPDDHLAESMRAAIKAAIRADREGS